MLTRPNAFTLVVLLLSGTCLAVGQRPRPVNKASTQPTPTTPPLAPAPPTVKAKYEGGVFGYSNKMNGNLSLD